MEKTVQNACEVLEELIKRDITDKILTTQEFLAINTVLLELSIRNGYVVPDRFK